MQYAYRENAEIVQKSIPRFKSKKYVSGTLDAKKLFSELHRIALSSFVHTCSIQCLQVSKRSKT
jgi:hypothetical protein